jgi:hypothetical protein
MQNMHKVMKFLLCILIFRYCSPVIQYCQGFSGVQIFKLLKLKIINILCSFYKGYILNTLNFIFQLVMKNSLSFFIAALILIILVISCEKKKRTNANEWYDEDKKEFLKDCEKPSNHPDITKEKVKIYCECMMEKIMKKYPRYSDTYNREKSEFKEMMKECDEKAGIENNE